MMPSSPPTTVRDDRRDVTPERRGPSSLHMAETSSGHGASDSQTVPLECSSVLWPLSSTPDLNNVLDTNGEYAFGVGTPLQEWLDSLLPPTALAPALESPGPPLDNPAWSDTCPPANVSHGLDNGAEWISRLDHIYGVSR